MHLGISCKEASKVIRRCGVFWFSQWSYLSSLQFHSYFPHYTASLTVDLNLSFGPISWMLWTVKDISITEGTYLAAVVLVGNTIKVKHTAVFASTRNGLEESGGSYQKTDGLYCVTRLDSGSEDDFASNLDCGDDTLLAGLFSETDGAYDTSGIGGRCLIVSDEIDSNISFTTASGETDVCGMLDTETLETYDGSGDTNATRQLVVQTFTNPVVVRASTKSMAIQFKVTDMLSIEANDKVVSGTSSLYTQAYLDGFEIKIDVN